MTRLVVVSNRVAKGGSGKGSAGGLAVGVMAAMEESGGVWFGWNGKIEKNLEQPQIERWSNTDYITIGLKQSEYNRYYKGFANSVLWPVFHQRPDLMVYRSADYAGYLDVNRKFAQTLLQYLQPDDIIWIHDYHLIPLGGMLREAGVTSPIGYFLHTPFPPLDLLRAIPAHKTILNDLLAYDLVGFQTETDHRSFGEAIVYSMKGSFDDASGVARCNGRSTTAGVYPIGIETASIPEFARRGAETQEYIRLQDSLNDRKLIIGVDRLDYSKGLLERFCAYEDLLRRHQKWHRNVVYLQIAPVSRGDVQAYGDLADELDGAAGHIIGTYADFDWMPLRYLNRGFRRSTILAMYKLAQVGLVTPLRDGMNLVAKEYVAAQDPEDPGVLILSKMAGASAELDAAVIVNPYDHETMTNTLAKALHMPIDERKDRWRRMMDVLQKNNIHEWHSRYLADLDRVSQSGA